MWLSDKKLAVKQAGLEFLQEGLTEDWLLSLVDHALRRANPRDAELEASEAQWQPVRRQVAAKNLLFFAELRQVLEKFKDQGIKVIILKGAALTERIYPHMGLRPFGDIDFLIHREDLPLVTEIMISCGYQPYAPELTLDVEDLQTSVNYIKHGEQAIMLEPHWALGRTYPYAGRLDERGLWERAIKVNIAGMETLTLSPEDFLLHLCLHLVQHSPGVWLTSACDIAELLYYYHNFDWDTFLDRTSEYQLCLPVQYSLAKAWESFRPPIPTGVWERLTTYKPSWFERRVFAVLTGRSTKGGPLAQLLTTPGLARKLRFVWTLLFPSQTYMASRHAITSRKMLPVYYFLRLGYAFRLAFNGLISLFFRKEQPSTFAVPKSGG
jgi:Uncharacterised nucleotidyltransferase